jgi:carboxymethylenebutenolidase
VSDRREGAVHGDAAANKMPEGETIISLHAGYDTNGVYTNAFLARPADSAGPRPGVVLLSGMHGLSWTQREITRLYARAGFVALSPDYMGGQLPEGRSAALLAKNSLDVGPVVEALAGGAAFLRSLPWVGAEGKVGIMGFCLGGGLVLLACGRTAAFDAGVVYHQSLFPDVRELAGIRCNLQCHYGTDDHSTPRDEVEAFTQAMDRLGKPYELHWYEGMPHSFAQITPDADVPPARRAASDLSYQRSFEFLHRELGGGRKTDQVAAAE